MTNDEAQIHLGDTVSSFRLRHSFDIRHWDFVISLICCCVVDLSFGRLAVR